MSLDGMAGSRLRDQVGEESAEPRRVRWSVALVWFMRILALLWIAKGLGSWAVILGAGYPVPSFEARSMGHQATIIYFSVIDLVAAIGLWLASSWGGVMWLLAVMSHLILAIFFPAIVPSNAVSTVISVTFIALYLVISWLAAHEE